MNSTPTSASNKNADETSAGEVRQNNYENDEGANDTDTTLEKETHNCQGDQSRTLTHCETASLSFDDGSEESITSQDGEQVVNEEDNEYSSIAQNSTTTSTPPTKTAPSAPNRKVVWQRWSLWTAKLHQATTRLMVALSVLAARNPKRCIGIGVTLSFALLIIGFATNFNVNVEESEIYAPFGSIPQQHYQWRDEESGFSKSTRATVLILHNHGENMLHTANMRRVFEAVDTVRNTTGYSEVCQDGAFFNTDTKEYTCRIMSATRAWYHNIDLFDDQVISDQDLAEVLSLPEYAGGTPFDHEYVMGNIVREANDLGNGTSSNNNNNNNNGTIIDTITHVPAFFVYFLLTDKDEQTLDLEEAILESLFDLKARWKEEAGGNDILELDFFAERSFGDEFKRAIETDMYLLPVIFCIMSCFTCLVFYKKDCVKSRCLVGLGSVATIVMSLFSGFGIMFIAGVPFTSMTQMLPFLVFGVGLDDTFIITGAYFRTDPNTDVVSRIEETMLEVGNSIFVTTLTTAVAFMLGLTSTVPAIYWLCLYAVPTVLIDLLFQVTIFVAIIVLDEQRIQQNRYDCCTCLTAGKIDESEDELILMETPDQEGAGSEDSVATGKKSMLSIQSTTSDEEDKKPSKQVADRIMEWYAVQLMRPVVKAVVIIFFALMFALCAYRASLLTQEFDVMGLFPDGSYMRSALENLYANQERTVAVDLTFRQVNQSDPVIQQQMIDFIDDVIEMPAFGAEPPICWVRDFQLMRDTDLFEPISDLPFGQQLQYALSIPAIKEAYSDDLSIDEEGTIVASRCRILVKNSHIENVEDKIALLNDQRAITNEQPINQGRKDEAFFTFANIYVIFEFYSIAVEELIFTTVASILAVSIVAFIFIPHWSAICFMIPMISIVYIDLLGVMQMVGLHINAVTYVCLVISVGLIVDFLLHIMLRYTESTQKTREEKVKDTLGTMGASMLLGGLSTFLGVVPLSLSTCTILRTVFTALCSMIILAITHGLILLPVVLSLVGPAPRSCQQVCSKLDDEDRTACSPVSSRHDSPQSLSHSSSWASFLGSPPGNTDGHSEEETEEETVEQFIANCANEIAEDAFPDDPAAAVKEQADLAKVYTGIFQSTLDPYAFLAKLRGEVAEKRKARVVEDAC